MSSVATIAIGSAVVGGVAADRQQDKAIKAGKTPRHITEADKFVLERGRNIADRTYRPYNEQRFAELSDNERTASQLASSAVTNNQSRSYLQRAGGQAQEIADSDWNEETAKKYMDPYVSQVVDSALRDEGRAYASRQSQIAGNAARVGAFGGDRQAILEAGETGRHLEAVGDISAKGYSQAFSQAFQGWQADNDRRARASDAFRAVGGDISRLNSTQITDLMKTGEAARVIEQAGLDFDYGQWIENRDWDVTNLQPMIQALGSVRGVNGQQTPPTSNIAGQVLGLGSALIGYFGGRKDPNAMGSAAPVAIKGSDGMTQTFGMGG